jgi:PAS domain S-box-containing protein
MIEGKNATRRYLPALLAPAVITGVMQVTWPFFADSPVSLYLLAVIFCAWYGGLAPGLLAVVVSFLLTDFFFVEPYSLFRFSTKGNPIRLVIFSVVGAFICVMSEVMHRERRRAEINLESAERAEGSLQEKERFVNQIAELSPVVISVFDLTTRSHVYISPDVVNLLGYSPKELAKMEDQFSSLLHPEDIPQASENLARLKYARDGEIAEVEYRIRRRDGEWRRIASRMIPFERDEQGVVRQIITASLDITERKRAEESLQLFHNLIDRSSDAIEIIDANTLRFLDCNESAYQTLGYTREEFLSLTVFDIDTTTNPESIARTNEVMEKSGYAIFESVHLRKDGSTFPVEVNVKVVRLERDYRLAVVRDITQRKRAEEALRRSSEELESVMSSVSDYLWSGEVDSQGRWVYRYYSPVVEKITGRPPEFYLQGPERWLSTVYVEDRPRLLEAFERILKGQSKHEKQEYRFVRPDGTIHWVCDSARATRLAHGGIRVDGVVSDITERKLAEEQLKQSERQLAEAQHLARVGSWNWDLQSNALTLSDEVYRIFGVDSETFNPAFEEFVGKFVHEEDRALVRDEVERCLQTQEPFNFYYRILRPDGGEVVVHARGDVASDTDGTPIRMFGTAQDVTERKHAEEKLKATTQQLRALSASLQAAREEEGTRIAREIHDELGAVLSSLRWDLEGVDEALSELVDQAKLQEPRKKIAAMIRLTETTFNTVRRIASELRPVVLDTLGLVPAIEWHARQFQQRTGIVVQCDLTVESVDLSREQSTAAFRIFQEALTNILRHAQATRVNIQMNEEEGQLILTVRDNGRGITDVEKSGRHTLGLLGMRERAHLIGWKFDITRSDGKGTMVTVRIPV